MRIGIVAGEASGDILGARLIAALKQHIPNLEVEGIAGPLMIEQGAHSLYPMEKLSVMGITEVLGRYRELSAIRNNLTKHFLDERPDVFIGIDAPDFNLGLEEKLHRQNIKTVHYVSPSVWAWKQGRIKKIERAVDLLLTLFPFEQVYYKDHDVRAEFVGHPLADEIEFESDQSKYRNLLNLDKDKKIIALLPGSRKSEISQLADVFIEAATMLYAENNHLHFIAPMANENCKQLFEQSLANLDEALPITVIIGQSREAMAAADVVLLASGTATLEALLLKKPMVVTYRFKKLSYWIINKMVKLDKYSLPNLLADKHLVPELIQDDVTAEAITSLINKYLYEQEEIKSLKHEFQLIHESLKMNASEQAAKQIIKLVN